MAPLAPPGYAYGWRGSISHRMGATSQQSAKKLRNDVNPDVVDV